MALSIPRARGPADLRASREARVLGRVGDHPGTVTLYDVVLHEGAPRLVLQLLSGGDLAARLARQGTAPTLAETLRIGRDLAQALAHCHERGIVHGALKPGHVLLSEDGRAVLCDFALAASPGISPAERVGPPPGMAAYLAPELVLGKPVDARADLYALGALLYELLSGRPPFVADDDLSLMSHQLGEAPADPRQLRTGIPDALAALVLQLLAKDPDERPQSSDEVDSSLAEISGPAGPGAAALQRPDRGGSPLTRVFVGRAAELRQSHARLEAALAGRGGTLLISGEPGSGKTHTAEVLSEAARERGVRVVLGQAYEGEGAPPFWPWVQVVRACAQGLASGSLLEALGPGAAALAELVPEVGQRLPPLARPPELPPEQSRFRLFDALSGFLARMASEQPLLLVLDDLHWADGASLQLLQFLGRTLPGIPVLVVGTYRSDSARSDLLADTVDDLVRLEGTETLRLDGLDDAEIADLIERTMQVTPASGLVAAIRRRTEGNPFFVLETIRLLASEGKLEDPAAAAWPSLPLPSGIRDVTDRRLGQLSPSCRETLRVAAVAGRDFGSSTLGRLGELDASGIDPALDEALRAGVLLAAEGDRYRFSHALVREALYEQIAPSRRAHLHRRIAEVLEENPGPDPGTHLSELAYHFAEGVPAGGELLKAAGYALRAGRRSKELSAFDDAVPVYERALHALQRAGTTAGEHVLDLLLELSEARFVAFGPESAQETAHRALQLARSGGGARRLAKAALSVARATPYSIVPAASAVEALEEATAALEAEPPSPDHVYVLAEQARILLVSARERAHTLADRAVELARRTGDRRCLVPALVQRAQSSPETAVHEEVGLELQGLSQELDHPGGAAAADAALMAVAYARGDGAEWRRRLAIQGVRVEHGRIPGDLFFHLRDVATRAILEGDWAEAERAGERARQIGAKALGPDLARELYASQQHCALLARDRLEPLVASLEQAVGQRENPWIRAHLAGLLARVGREAEARRALEDLARDGYEALSGGSAEGFALAWLADACTSLCARQHAETLYEALEPWTKRYADALAYAPPILQSRASLAGLLGRNRQAIACFEASLRWSEGLGVPFWHAHTQCEYARFLARLDRPGDRANALDLLDAALAFGRSSKTLWIVRRALAARLELEPGAAADPGPRGELVGDAPARSRAEPEGVGENSLRLDGEYWTVCYEGLSVHVKDVKGLHDLMLLLHRPGTGIRALELMADESAVPGALNGESVPLAGSRLDGDAGPRLDARARADYRRRLGELEDELAEAERWNDAGRKQRLLGEIELVSGELSSSLGLGGRPRRDGRLVERARKAVTMRLRYAIQKVAQVHPTLGQHLRESVRTGAVCVYQPAEPVDWSL